MGSWYKILLIGTLLIALANAQTIIKLWEVEINPTSGQDLPYGICLGNDGYIYLVGSVPIGGTYNGYVAKIVASTGKLVRNITLPHVGDSSYYNAVTNCVAVGDFIYPAGRLTTSSGADDYIVFKVPRNLNISSIMYKTFWSWPTSTTTAHIYYINDELHLIGSYRYYRIDTNLNIRRSMDVGVTATWYLQGPQYLYFVGVSGDIVRLSIYTNYLSPQQVKVIDVVDYSGATRSDRYPRLFFDKSGNLILLAQRSLLRLNPDGSPVYGELWRSVPTVYWSGDAGDYVAVAFVEGGVAKLGLLSKEKLVFVQNYTIGSGVVFTEDGVIAYDSSTSTLYLAGYKSVGYGDTSIVVYAFRIGPPPPPPPPRLAMFPVMPGAMFIYGDTAPHGVFNGGAGVIDVAGGTILAGEVGRATGEGVGSLLDVWVVSRPYNVSSISWGSLPKYVISVGGPLVNMFTYALNPTDRVGYGGLPFYFDTRRWLIVDGRDGSTYGPGHFVAAMLYVMGRYVLLVWGYGGLDTYAAAVWLATAKLPPNQAVLVRWVDSNNNGVPDGRDAYQIVKTWN